MTKISELGMGRTRLAPQCASLGSSWNLKEQGGRGVGKGWEGKGSGEGREQRGGEEGGERRSQSIKDKTRKASMCHWSLIPGGAAG